MAAVQVNQPAPSHSRDKAAACRRLADGITNIDSAARLALIELAEAYDAVADGESTPRNDR